MTEELQPTASGDVDRGIVAAIYCRLSRFGGKGLGRQEKDCRKIADARGWAVGEVFPETASASPYAKKARKQWHRLLEAIERHEFDAVIVWLEDRTNRNVVEAAEFVKVCQDAGVHRVIISGSDTEYDFRDPEDVARFYGESARAQQELARIQKRIRRQKQELAEVGEWNGGGRRAFGWADDRRTIVEPEAELLREAARRILAGDSLRGIVVEWNRKGILTSAGCKWRNSHLRRMLIGTRIAGLREYDGKLIPAVWPAILERETWEAVRAILTDPSRKTTKGAPAGYLLTGLIWGAVCGHRLNGKRVQIGKYKEAYYTCAEHCVKRNIRDVDREVTQRLLYRLESTAFEQAASRPADDPARELYEELAREQGLYDRLEDKLARELISEQTYKRNRAESERRMDTLRAKIASLTDSRVITKIPRNIREVWPDLSLDRKRAILSAVIHRVEIHPQGTRRFDPEKISVLWKA